MCFIMPKEPALKHSYAQACITWLMFLVVLWKNFAPSKSQEILINTFLFKILVRTTSEI